MVVVALEDLTTMTIILEEEEEEATKVLKIIMTKIAALEDLEMMMKMVMEEEKEVVEGDEAAAEEEEVVEAEEIEMRVIEVLEAIPENLIMTISEIVVDLVVEMEAQEVLKMTIKKMADLAVEVTFSYSNLF